MKRRSTDYPGLFAVDLKPVPLAKPANRISVRILTEDKLDEVRHRFVYAKYIGLFEGKRCYQVYLRTPVN